MTPREQAYRFVKRVLEKELFMRKRYLSGLHGGEQKVTECLDALRALDILYTPEAAEVPAYNQETLFK
jgi:hypothetical protein